MPKLPRQLAVIISLFTSLVLPDLPVAQTAPASADGDADVLIKLIKTPFRGDFDQIQKRRLIRVLVNYSRTRYFYEFGKARGFEYELLKAYEKELNKGVKSYKRVKLIFVPVPFDQLLTALDAGKGDIAAAGLTITPDREKQAAFEKLANEHAVPVKVIGEVTDGKFQIESVCDLDPRKLKEKYYSCLPELMERTV